MLDEGLCVYMRINRDVPLHYGGSFAIGLERGSIHYFSPLSYIQSNSISPIDYYSCLSGLRLCFCYRVKNRFGVF